MHGKPARRCPRVLDPLSPGNRIEPSGRNNFKFSGPDSVQAGGLDLDANFVKAVLGLKEVKRRGWLQSGVPEAECECVSDHSFGVTAISIFLAMQKGLDVERVATMALTHDLAEVVIGDITPDDTVSAKEKISMELKAIMDLVDGLEQTTADRIIGALHEYLEGTSPEAQLVRDVDVFERTVQAGIYRSKGYNVDRFFKDVKSIRDPDLRELMDTILG
jgi:putative hydrolase of HD superfamily